MVYSDLTLRRVKQDFGLSSVNGGRFLPEVEPITNFPMLLEKSLARTTWHSGKLNVLR